MTQVSMLGDNMNADLLDNMYSKISILMKSWMSPEPWATDLVESMPWHQPYTDLFGRDWTHSIAPDGYLYASQMARVPIIAAILALVAGKIPAVSKIAAGGTAVSYRYRNAMRKQEYFEELDEKVDVIVENTSKDSGSSRARIQRDITYAEKLLTLTSAGLATNHHTYRTELVKTLKNKGSI